MDTLNEGHLQSSRKANGANSDYPRCFNTEGDYIFNLTFGTHHV